MTLTDVSGFIDAGKYSYKLPFPMRFSKNHIFDAEKSAGWNRDEVERRNQEIQKEQERYIQKRKDVDAAFRSDLAQAIIDCFGLNKAQAERIVSKAWNQGNDDGLRQVIFEAQELAEILPGHEGVRTAVV